MAFSATPLAIRDVLFITATPHADVRGRFTATYERAAFAALGIGDFVQDNEVVSTRAGTVRGLHFQRGRQAQGKLVRALRGAIFDVAVDLRRRSPTFGKWVGMRLDADTGGQVYVPRGFAHGYATLADDTVVTYKCDAPYAPATEAGIHFADARLAIAWPIDVAHAILSDRDRALPSFDAATAGDGE